MLANIIKPKQDFLWLFTLTYAMVIVLANWFDPRLIKIFGLTTDAGTLIFPLTFLLSDLITEVYGYKHARRTIWCGFLFNTLFIIYGQLIIHMPSPDYVTNNDSFDALFKTNIRIILASSISYFFAEPLNSFIIAKLKIKMRGQYIGIRFLSSTIIAAGTDSFIFSFIAFYNTMSNKNLLNLILTMWLIKIMIEIIGLPFSIRLAKKIKQVEELDIYDRRTDFNFFKLDTDYINEDNEFKKNTLTPITLKKIIKNRIKAAPEIDSYYISTDTALLDKEKIYALLKGCFWSKNIPLEYVHRFIKYSLCFGIYKKYDNQLVGFGRVVSDFTTYAYICDIVIDPLHQKKGLGHTLVKTMLSYPELQGLKTWALRTTDEARKIYEQHGFKIANYPHTQLEINDLDIYSYPDFNNLHKTNTVHDKN